MTEGEEIASFIGMVAISISIGTITEAAYGWLTFGCGLILLVLISISTGRGK